MPPSRPTDRLAMPSLQPTKPRKTHQQVYCQIISYGNDGSSVNNVPLLLFFSRHLDCRSMYIYIYTIIYILYVCVNMWILCILHIDTNVYYNNLIEYIWLHTYILCMYVIYTYTHAYHPCNHNQPRRQRLQPWPGPASMAPWLIEHRAPRRPRRRNGREMEHLEAVGIRSLWVNTY